MTGHLAAELSAGLAALQEIAAEVKAAAAVARKPQDDPMAVDALAARLHRLYGCVEDMAYRVSVLINGEVPGGAHSHRDLLDRTATEVPGKRRALWRQASLEDLHELRKFRHFFRTRYAARLDREKVLAVAEVALQAMPLVEADVRSFIAGLGATSP